MNSTCNFCLECHSTLNKISDKDVIPIIKTIFPTKNINSFKNAVICDECHSNLNSTFDFISSAKENINKMCATTIKNENFCRTCITPVTNGAIYLFDHFENAVPYYEIKEMLDYSLLDLDVETTQCPVICNTCWEKLKISYQFLKKCADNEKRAAPSSGNSITDADFAHIEFDLEMVKREPLEDEIEDNSLGTLTECDEYYSCYTDTINFKNERLDRTFGKELYVKLERLYVAKVPHQMRRKSKKTNPISYRCHVCSFTTRKKSRYEGHITTHMTLEECAKVNSLFKCHDCPYRTKRKYSLIRHFKEVHRLAFVCEKCDYQTNSALSFKLHVQTEHNNNLVSYACNECSYIAFTKIKLHQHVKTHDLQHIILKCSHCEFETREVVYLNEHRMCHKHMKVGKLYKCEMCSYQVKKKTNITRHVLTHFTKKQLSATLHECSVCHYKCKRKDALAVHIRNQHRVQHKKDK